MKAALKQLNDVIEKSKDILVLQPEKPDGDSLATSLALEEILGDLGKNVVMYCRDQVPEYIRITEGWDRVSDEFPAHFDMTILVDTGGPQMVARTLEKHQSKLAAKPFFILDHHASREPMPFDTIDIVDTGAAATSQILLDIARQLSWTVNAKAAQAMAAALLSDTQNLTLPNVTPDTVQALADITKLGADLFMIHQKRRETDALTPELLYLKGRLLQRVHYYADQRIATLIVTPEELKQYAELHDPADLVIYMMQGVKNVKVAAVLRDYGTKIKGSLRANIEVAAPAAAHFGGGGHPRAAGFRVEQGSAEKVEQELVEVLTGLVEKHETI